VVAQHADDAVRCVCFFINSADVRSYKSALKVEQVAAEGYQVRVKLIRGSDRSTDEGAFYPGWKVKISEEGDPVAVKHPGETKDGNFAPLKSDRARLEDDCVNRRSRR